MVSSVVLPEFLLCLEFRPTATALVAVPGQERGMGAHYSHPGGVRVGESLGNELGKMAVTPLANMGWKSLQGSGPN